MAGAGAIRAGRAFVELFADDSKLVRTLNRAGGKLKSWGANVAKVGAAIFAAGGLAAGALLGASKTFATIGDDIQKASIRTGIAAENISTLGYAAGQSGADMESLENGIRRMQKLLVDAAEGSTTARDTLARLGISLQELDGLTPDEQLKRFSNALARFRDPTLKAGLAMEVFGKSGTKLLPLLGDGAQAIEALQQRARDLGLEMSTDDANAAAALGDSFDDLLKSIRGIWSMIGASLAPALTEASNQIAVIAGRVSKWIGENRGLVRMVAIGVIAVVALGGAILGVGLALTVAGTALAGFGSLVGAISSILGGLLSPIGLVAAAVAALTVTWANSTGAMGQLTGWLGEMFGALQSDVLDAFGAIKDALAAGDWQAAAKVLWSLLKLEFQRGMVALNEIWLPVQRFFVDTWAAAVKNVADLMLNLVYQAEKAWNALKDKREEGVNALAKQFAEDNLKGQINTARTEAFAKAQRESQNKGGRWLPNAEDRAAGERAADEAEAKVRRLNRFTIPNLDEEEQKRKENAAKRKADLDRAHQDALDANRAILDGKFAQNDAAAKAARDKAAADLKAAQDEYQKALAAARQPGGGALRNVPGRPEIGNLINGLSGALAPKASVSGTFSSVMLGQTFGGSDRLLDINKKMERHLARIAKKEQNALNKQWGTAEWT